VAVMQRGRVTSHASIEIRVGEEGAWLETEKTQLDELCSNAERTGHEVIVTSSLKHQAL